MSSWNVLSLKLYYFLKNNMKKTQEKQRANLPTLKKRKKPNESIRKMNKGTIR